MTLDETEITRIRFEDLSDSLQNLINNLIFYDDLDYINLRIKTSTIADSVNSAISIYAGDKIPPTISLGKTVYFDTPRNSVRVSDSLGNWVYVE
jgi:hypothetical protein